MTDTPRVPGLRIHMRTLLVQGAEATIALNLIRLQDELTLTDVEMLRAVLHHAHQISTRLLRAERHPDDPSRKADEA